MCSPFITLTTPIAWTGRSPHVGVRRRRRRPTLLGVRPSTRASLCRARCSTPCVRPSARARRTSPRSVRRPSSLAPCWPRDGRRGWPISPSTRSWRAQDLTFVGFRTRSSSSTMAYVTVDGHPDSDGRHAGSSAPAPLPYPQGSSTTGYRRPVRRGPARARRRRAGTTKGLEPSSDPRPHALRLPDTAEDPLVQGSHGVTNDSWRRGPADDVEDPFRARSVRSPLWLNIPPKPTGRGIAYLEGLLSEHLASRSARRRAL